LFGPSAILEAVMIRMLALLAVAPATAAVAPAGDAPKKPAVKKTVRTKEPPALTWLELQAALLKARSSKRPVAVLFAPESYRGAGTFTGKVVRAALDESEALVARVRPPARPKLPEKPTSGACDRLIRKYQAKRRDYEKLASGCGVRADESSVVLLAPDGRVLSALARPDAGDLLSALEALPGRLAEVARTKSGAEAGEGSPGEEAEFALAAPAAPDRPARLPGWALGRDGLPVVGTVSTGTVFDVRPVVHPNGRYISLEVRATFAKLKVEIPPKDED